MAVGERPRVSRHVRSSAAPSLAAMYVPTVIWRIGHDWHATLILKIAPDQCALHATSVAISHEHPPLDPTGQTFGGLTVRQREGLICSYGAW
jgi:hypothetical protein